VVYKGTWKGVDVAVKRFIKQNLDERRLLEFRAEMAFLSELHHPNIILFIGALSNGGCKFDWEITTLSDKLVCASVIGCWAAAAGMQCVQEHA